jgi:nucleoside 2-deoxyribosyltransferase
MKNIYLSSTFRHEWNREFHPKIGNILIQNGLTCVLPIVYDPKKETEADVFQRDLDGINNSEVILAIAENESPNWGGEVGYAYGIKKPIIALANKDHKIPLMLNGMITEIFYVENLDHIDNYLERLISTIKKYLD